MSKQQHPLSHLHQPQLLQLALPTEQHPQLHTLLPRELAHTATGSPAVSYHSYYSNPPRSPPAVEEGKIMMMEDGSNMLLESNEGEMDNQSDLELAAPLGDDNWNSRGRTKSKKEKGKQQLKKIGGSGEQQQQQQQQQKNTVLLLIDDEKVKPIEVDLACKTYPKEHEAFTSAFLRQNDFARKIFTGGDKLLKWYFQEDHLTFPRLCLIYQNRCSNGRTNPWVPKLIRNGPSLRGPVVLVQQKKSPNAETVVFDQYRREDRHMLPAAASFLHHASCDNLPTRAATAQRPPMRASAPPLSVKAQGGAAVRSSAAAMDEGVQPQHPYLSSGYAPTAPPYTLTTLSSQPGSPSSSSPSSSSSSPSTTPPSSVPHSPRGSFSGSMFVSSPATTTRPSTSSSFPTLPIMQSDSAVSLSGSHSSLPPYTSAHYFSPPLSSGGAHPPEPVGFDVGMMEMPSASSLGSSGAVPVSRSSEDFSGFPPSAFSYSLWSYPTSSAPSPSAAPHRQHHQQQQQRQQQQQQQPYSSAEGMLSLSQHAIPTQPQHQPISQPLSLSTSGIYVPSHHQYRPETSPRRPPARHFSWEGPLEKLAARPVESGRASTPSITAPTPVPAPAPARRASSDGGDKRGIDEEIIEQLKKVRDAPGSPKAKVARLTSTYEEYLKSQETAAHEAASGGTGGAKKRSGSGRAVAAPPSAHAAGVARKTKLYCRTLIFVAKVARLSAKCEEDARDKRALAKWEELMRSEVGEMLADEMMDRHLVDRILLACFVQRRVQTARDLVREIIKQAPTAVSREEWALLADRYEQFSPWLAAFLRNAGERPPAELDQRDARVTLRIIRRRSARDHGGGDDDNSEEEVFRTVAPLSATVDELKQKLWQEQGRLAAESGDESQLLRPSDMGVIYRTWKGGEVSLQGSDKLHDYLMPHPAPPLEPAAAAKDDLQKSRSREREDSRRARNGKVEPTPAYDVIITHEPRLLAFAHFPDLARCLAKLRGMIDSDERSQWNASVGIHNGHRGATLYDFLCHHFEYLEEQNRRLVRHERKERQRRKERAMMREERQKKDAENGYRDQQGRKEKRMEAREPGAPGHRDGLHGDDGFNLADGGASSQPRWHVVRFLATPAADEQPSVTDRKPGRQGGGGGRVERCAFHLGSLTKEDEEPLYAVFTKNPAWPFHAHQRWVFHAWSDEFSLVEKHGLSSSASAPSSSSSAPSPRSVAGLLPSPPRYFGNVEDLYLIPGVKIYLNPEHILRAKANCKKFDQCAYTREELAFVTDMSRRASLDFALSRCLRAIQNDPSLAVPQSRADASGDFHLEFLAPLYVKPHKSMKPDLAVALERRYDSEGRLSCYVGTTLLTLPQAYANARRVKKIRQTWLAAAHWRIDGLAAGDKRSVYANGIKSKAARSREEDDDEESEDEDEFKGFEQEIEKWVSETEGEESEEERSSGGETNMVGN